LMIDPSISFHSAWITSMVLDLAIASSATIAAVHPRVSRMPIDGSGIGVTF
jgi:hypothetical protein